MLRAFFNPLNVAHCEPLSCEPQSKQLVANSRKFALASTGMRLN